MLAVILKDFGGVENLVADDIPEPTELKPDEVLVQVRGIGIDPIDVKTREGGGMAAKLKEEKPMILGWDLSGVVIKRGENVKDLRIGDQVFGTIRFPGVGRTYAEYVVAPASELAIKPEILSFTEAAAATQSPLTAWQALVETGGVKTGDKVLIHGASGGVGSFAVQIAKQLGAYVIGTGSGDHKDFILGLGADEFIDYKTQRFEEIANDVDFVLDTVGGETFVRSLGILKSGGNIVLLPSDKKDLADKVAEAYPDIHYHPVLMHSSGENMKEIARWLSDGRLKVHVSRTFTFRQIPQAHSYLTEGGHTGKIAVEVAIW